LAGDDPCNYELGDAEACIGGWDGASLKEFWCEKYKYEKEGIEKQATDSRSAAMKYYASYYRVRLSQRSLSAFYRHCTYLLYMQVCALIVTAIVLYFLHFKGGAAPAPAAKSEEA
jgi:hypothetical protein